MRLYLRDPRWDAPRYKALEEGDDYYSTALAGYHIQDKILPMSDRRGFLIALCDDWPKVQGDHRELDHRAFVVQTLLAGGRTVEEIAERFCVQADTVTRWVRHGERVQADLERIWAEQGAESQEIRVETEWPDQVPEHPGSAGRYMRWLMGNPARMERWVADFRRGGLLGP